MSSYFSCVSPIPPDPIFGLDAAFQIDPRKEKINLSVGVYKDDLLQTPVLTCVKEAEKLLLQEEQTKNYLPIEGDPMFLREASKLLLGRENLEDVCTAQSVGGSGGLRLGGDLLQVMQKKEIYIPSPSWLNHTNIFSQCGLKVLEYPYYDFEKKDHIFPKMAAFLRALPKGSIILLHVNCHNPSGADLGQAEWRELMELFIEKEHIAFFDAAYLGFDVSFEEDCFPIRLFMDQKMEFLLSVSFAKNFSLYGERAGFFLVSSAKKNAQNVLSQVKRLIRRNYSNPPLHGARIVGTILQNPVLRALWEEELSSMRKRISKMRSSLLQELSMQSKKDYSYLRNKKGLFSFFSLTKEQVEQLIKEYGIYMTLDGRMNIAGLTQERIPYVVKAIVSVGG